MATENLMMAAVQAGADRQEVHELVRAHSHAVTLLVKEGAGEGAVELLTRLKSEPQFANVDFEKCLEPSRYTGRSSEQVGEFVQDHIDPIRRRYAAALGMTAELNV